MNRDKGGNARRPPALDAGSLGADAVRTVEDYKQWIRGNVRRVFPHEMLASGFGHMHAGGVSLDYVVNVDFPMRHLEQLPTAEAAAVLGIGEAAFKSRHLRAVQRLRGLLGEEP